ncbi:apolipoprotein N-acyltransferase, partial [Pseudonocardia sp. KRD-188]|nr:apolipoprotein N-acyltransferase [Pseudonocardia oceani]
MAAPTTDPAPPAGAHARPRALVPVRLLAAAGGGYLLYLSFPPSTLWWLALPAFGLLGAVLRGRSAGGGALYGFVFSMAFLTPLLVWVSSLVQWLPWIALSVFESLFVAV